MNIAKAIEIQEKVFKDRSSSSDVEVFDAIRLGIEALKVYRKLTKTSVLPKGYLLPGETKD